MKKLIVIVALLLFCASADLFAKSCSDHEAAYDMALFMMNEKGQISYRKSYDLVNDLIDTATEYLAYCKEEIVLADQYQIQQVIKKSDKKRREYFRGAVREYHAIYGIRPNVTEIYQDGSFSGGASGGTGYTSPPRFPPVRQPQMPPVQQ